MITLPQLLENISAKLSFDALFSPRTGQDFEGS